MKAFETLVKGLLRSEFSRGEWNEFNIEVAVSELDDLMNIAVEKIAQVSTIVGSLAKNIGCLVDEMVEAHVELVELEITISLGYQKLGLFKLSTEKTLQTFTNVIRSLAGRQNELIPHISVCTW